MRIPTGDFPTKKGMGRKPSGRGRTHLEISPTLRSRRSKKGARPQRDLSEDIVAQTMRGKERTTAERTPEVARMEEQRTPLRKRRKGESEGDRENNLGYLAQHKKEEVFTSL